MRTKNRILLVALCATLTTASLMGQTTYTWTNQAGGDIATAANWSPNGQPSGANSDMAVFDGKTTGPLTVWSSSTALPGTGFGTSGIGLEFTANQISSVTFTSTVQAFSGSAPYGVNNITLDPGAGPITFGAVGGSDRNYLYNFFGRPAGALHSFANNSTSVATINGTVRWQAGGGAAYTLDFSGPGDWVCNNYLVNDNNSGMLIQVDGPGKMTWNPTGYLGNSGINSPITINGGTLVLAGNHPKLNNQAISDSGTFEFNAPSQAQTLSGAISGSGTVQVNDGTLTLQGASSYSGNTILNGGELVVNSAENPGLSGPLGVGGTITFKGGTLGFSVNNVFDYSSRFDTSANQPYSIDTGGQIVTFTNSTGLTSSGGTLTKLGSGTLTLAGTNTYSGSTTISVGKLVFQGPMTGSGSISVADSSTLGVFDTGTQLSPATLTLGTSSGVTLEFNNVNSTTTPLIRAATLSAAGLVTMNINSGTLVPGNSYPLLAWTSGSAPAVSLGILNGFIGNLSTNSNSIQLNVTATAFRWTGANNGNWDLTSANNWIQNGAPVVFANGGPALFDDSASGTTTVTINALVQPTSVTFNNVNSNYSLVANSGNNLGGSATIIKSGSGNVVLSGGANTYTGATAINAGTLNVSALANGGVASDVGAASSSAGNLVLNGGTLQYAGNGASIDRLFTLGTAGGTIDSSGTGPLAFTNSASLGYSGNGPRTLTLMGSDTNGDMIAAAIGNNGGPTSLTKSGVGSWILTGTNTYSGATTIANGVLQVGAGGTGGSVGTGSVVNNGSIDFNRTGVLIVSGAISGTGTVTNDGTGTVILAGNNTFTGGTTVNAGTLQIGNGGATGSLDTGSPIVDNGTLVFNSSSPITIAGFNAVISGTGNVIVKGSGLVKAIGANTYSGWTEIDSGATFQPTEGNTGQLLSSVVTNNGTLKFVRQDNNVCFYSNNIVGSGKVWKDVNNFNPGDVTLLGTNTYAGGTVIAGGAIILGDGATAGAGSIVGNVVFTNSSISDDSKTLIFNRPDNVSFGGTISGSGSTVAGNMGSLVKLGGGVLTLTGNNSYAGTTSISNGVLQVGAGGTSGSIGAGTVFNEANLVFDRSDSLTVASVISGAGTLVQQGTGTLSLTATNTYTGATTVSNGTLVVGVVAGDLFLEGGTVAAAPAGSIGTLNVAGNLNIDSGTVLITLHKGLSQSNSLVVVTNVAGGFAGGIIVSHGTLKLVNAGPALVNGDKFTIFSEPVTGGAAMTIVSPGFSVQNNLAVDGSVTVTAIQPPPTITTSVSGGTQLNLSWPSSWAGGVLLQGQTNSITKGISTNWVTIAGTDAGNTYSVPINRTNGAVFYRLVSP